MSAELRELTGFASELADLSGEVLRPLFRAGVGVDFKADRTPVTEADRRAEEAIRDAIADRYPDHGVLGEEHGADGLDSTWVWVLDPIDGTKSFVTGSPLFGTLIALLRDGAPVVGVIDHPALGERWVGAEGAATTFQGTPVRTRPCASLADAWVRTTSPKYFTLAGRAAWQGIADASRHPVYGGDCYQYGQLASGWVDVVLEEILEPYDFCALVPVVAGAGGVISDWRGRSLGLDSVGRVLASGDRAVHEEAMDLLGRALDQSS